MIRLDLTEAEARELYAWLDVLAKDPAVQASRTFEVFRKVRRKIREARAVRRLAIREGGRER